MPKRDSLSSRASAKSKGYALCVGLNAVDPGHYDGWSGELNACEADALSMEALLRGRGFEAHLVLTKSATRSTVLSCLRSLVVKADPGDTIVFTNSSHGGQVPNYDLRGDESDGMDETICMFDGEIIDDELANIWAAASPGVRIMMVSDSCHSGTVERVFSNVLPDRPKNRAMPALTARLTYEKNKAFYDSLPRGAVKIRASVLALGACTDDQTASDGAVNGLFTGTLLEVLRLNSTGTPGHVLRLVKEKMPATQTPKYTFVGVRMPAFEAAPLFKISLS